MKYWTQDDKYINPLRSWGCLYVSLVNLAIHITGKQFTASQILKAFYKDWQVDGDVDIESTVLDHEGVLTEFGVIAKYMGKYDASYAPSGDEYEILEYYNPATTITHFVVGDGKGKCLIDPWTNSVTVRDGKLKSKRIYKLIGEVK
jgi:hypothetical protein